jgi:RluA family pseudouridine synthase
MSGPFSIPVVHEEAGLLAVDKPEGISTIPERDPAVPSVQKLLEEARGERLFVVHRLDREVSGVVLFARDAEVHRALSIAFETRAVEKTYLAVAHGRIEHDRGTIDRPIAQFGSGRMGVHEGRGKTSRTDFVVTARHASATEVEVHPVTGRRHQIRVHFHVIGHALVGDPRYGDLAQQAAWPRLMLHAFRVRAPLFGRHVEVEVPPPESYRAVLASLRG